MSRRDDSFHSLRVMSSATGARLSTQPREYAETTLQANMSTVTVLDRIQSDQAMHVRRQARDFQQIELSEEYDKQYVWSVGDGMLLRSEEALFMVASSPHSLDLLRQKMPLSTTTRFIERLKIWEPVTPTTSVVRRRLGALVSPSEAVAMLRAVHQLLVSKARHQRDPKTETLTSSTPSRCCPRAAFAPSATFPTLITETTSTRSVP